MILTLARTTGWSEAELLRMPTRRALWYLRGLADLTEGARGD